MSLILEKTPGSAGVVVEGYASDFGLDCQGDQIDPGAFWGSVGQWKMRGAYVPFLMRHDPYKMAGICQMLTVDGKGLWVRAQVVKGLPAASMAEDLLARGVRGLSIGFVPTRVRQKQDRRIIEQLDLWEISLVEKPCNPRALISFLE
jgi:uncharacterized protein